MAGLSTGAHSVQVFHEKSRILPDVSRVLACLYEKGIEFDTGTTPYKSLLKLQASTHTPVPFYDGPTFLEESREICHYIAEKYDGYPFLLRKDALERASVEEWLHNEKHAFNPPSQALFCHLAFPPDKNDNVDDIDMHKRKLEEVLEVYEQRLSDSKFLVGNMFTLADLVHLPNSHYITTSEFVYLYDSRKNVRRWWEDISKRDSWQKVLKYMKKVEEPNQQEELKEQQQQKNHPRTLGYPIQIYSRKDTTTEPRTVLIRPAGTVSLSPIAPQTEKPLPIEIPDEPLVSSSQSTPTDHKTSVAKSKETPFQEKPPQQSHIPVQSTIAPATSPTTSEKSPIVDADRFSTKYASSPEPTKTDLPTRHKQSSSKDVSNNLHVFYYYKASSHSEEVTTYIESTPQKGSEILNQFSGSSIGHAKTSSIPAQEEPDQCSKFDFYKSDSTSTGVDSQDKDPVPYYEHTTQSARTTDTAASKPHTTDANQVAKEPSEQRVEALIVPIEPETFGVQSTSPSFPATTDHAVIDDKFAKQSIIDGRLEEPKQIQAPIIDARPASPTKTKALGGDTSDLEHASSSKGRISGATKLTPPVPATIHEDSHDAAIGKKTTKYEASGDKIITRPLHEQAQPPAQNHEAKEPIGGYRTSKEPQLRDSSQAEVARTERKSAISDQKPARSSQPLSPFEPVNIDSNDYEADDTIARQVIFSKQDFAKNIRRVPFSYRQSGTRKIREATPDYRHTEDSGRPLVPSEEEQISHASQEISHQEDMKYSPSARDSTKSDIQPPSTQVHEVTHDDQIVVSPLRSKDPTSQVQPPSGPSQDANPHISRIKHWQHASAPLNDMTTSSRDAMGMPTIDEKPRPWTQLRGCLQPEVAQTERKSALSDQKPARSSQPLSSVEPVNIDSDDYEADDIIVLQITFRLQARPFAPIIRGVPASDRQSGTRKIQEATPDYRHTEDSGRSLVPSQEEQISHAPQEEISHQEDMKYSPSARDSTKSDIQPPLTVVHKVTHDKQKVVSPLRSKDATSRVQPPSGPSQDANPYISTIKQWRCASTPLNDMTTSSRDATGMSTIDEKPRPWSQQGSRNGHDANQIAKEPDEQRVEAPILPIEPETFGVQSTSPSFPVTTDHVVIDDEFAKQSIIDERLGEPKQMQALITNARPASPTKRKTTNGLETGDLEHASSSEGQISDAAKSTAPIPATIHEDSHDVAISKNTTKCDPNEDQIITRPLDEQARSPAQNHEAKEPIGGCRTSKEPLLWGSSQSEVARTEHKSALSDQKPARSAQPISPVESTNIDSDDYEADDTIAPQMTFRQQARPSAPIIIGVPASDRQSGTRKIQEATPDYRHTKDSGKPLVPNQEEQISHAPQEISHQEDMKYSPNARDSTKSDIQPPSALVNEVTHDDQKVVSPLQSKDPTSRVEPPSGPSQDADPHVSTIKQWQCASAPLSDLTTISRDATGMPTIDEKPRPWSQQGSRNGHGANQRAQEPGEQRVKAPILPIEPETSGIQSTSPSFPATTDHVVIDDEIVKQSNIDERLEEPKQMQASIIDARPASLTKRKTPDYLETGDLEHANSFEGQISDAAKSTPPIVSTNREDFNDAVIDKETTECDSGDEVITEPLHEKARPLAQTHEAKEPMGGRRTSNEPQLRGSSQAEIASTERKSALSDQKPACSAQPLSPVELGNIVSDDYEADHSIAPQMTFQQQARPSASIVAGVPTSDRQSGNRKIQEATPYYRHTEDSGRSLVPSQEEQISHASQEIPCQEDMKYSPSARDSTKSDIHPPSAQVHEVTHDKQKVVSPLRSKDPTSRVQPPSGPSQDANPHISRIKHWQHASAPLNDMTTSSRDATVMPTIDEKLRPWSQQGSRNGHGANHMAKDPGEQRVETPIVPIEPETSGVQSTSPSFPTTTDHGVIDDEFAEQSIIDERLGEPKQMQAPITNACPASPTKKKTPYGLETSDLEHVSSSEGQISDAAKSTPPVPATIHEDSHDAAIGKKTTKYHASEDQIIIGPLHEQARPPAQTHEANEPLGGRRTSKEPLLCGSSQSEVARTEHKSALSDQKPARSAQPISRVEPMNIDSDDYEADDTIAPQMTFRQQARPSAPIIIGAPASDRQSGTRKIQEATPDYRHTKDSGKPLVRNQEEQISHASQEISRQEDMKYSPSARDSTKSDIQSPLTQVHEVNHDESGEKHGSHVGSTFRPNEFGATEKKFVPSSFGHSGDEPSSADPRKEYPVALTAKQIEALPAVIGQQGKLETREVPTSEDALDTISTNVDVHPTASTKAPRRSFSVQGAEPISSAQAPPFHMVHNFLHTGTTPDDALGNAQSMKPSASLDAQHGIAPGNTTDEVTPAEHKFVPSGQDSVHSKQSPPSAVQRNEVIGDSTPETQRILSMSPRKGDVATPDQAKRLRTTLDQQQMQYAPLRPPSSDTQRPSEKAREHIPADDLGEAASKPPSDIREVRQPTVVPASAPAARHGAATDEALDKQKFVPSGQDSVRSTQPPSSLEQRNGRIGDSAPSTQWISSTKTKKGDVASTPDQAKDSEITLRGQDILPPVRSVPPSSDIQHSSGKVHDVPANDLGEGKTIVQASAPDTQDETAQDEAAPDEKEFAPPESTSSTEPRNEERRDSAPSTQLISSTQKMKENATIGAPDQGKDLQTTLDQQDILSKPVKSPSPSSDTHRPSKKAREDAPSDDLGEATSKPSALVREVRPSTVVPRSTPVTQYGAARDEALDKQKFVPSGQDSVHSALLKNGEIGDPAPSTQQISSTMPRKGDAASSTPEQAKDTQITPGRHNILQPVRLESPSSDTQRPSGKVHKDVPADNLREAEPILQASAPDTQVEKKFVPSEPTSSTEPRNKEIRDSAPSAQLISSTGIRNEDAIIAAPDQDKDFQTTLDQQDILSAPVRSASPSSDTQHPSGKAREDALADDLRIRPLTVVPASGPATLHGAAPNETVHDEQKIVASGQDSAHSVQPSFSTEQTKEDTIVSAADQTEDLQTIIHRQNITPSTDTTKTPLPGEEQVPLGRDEGHATEPYRTAVDEKITTSPSSKAYSSESGSDLTQAHTDVHPSIGDGPTETSFPEHGLQTQPPLATHTSLGASNKAKSAAQEAKAPIASASETQPDSTQPQDEAAPIEQNFVVSDQESAHASKSPSNAEPRKGETYVFGPADETNLPLAVLGNQDTRQTPDAREALSKSQESSRDDGISNLADPLVSQEQASGAERASVGPTSEVRSATVHEKTALPSSQAGTSDTGPDSTLATGEAHLTNADMPATSSLQNQEAQPLAATQAPTTQAPPASSQNVHADSLENIETPRQPSKAPPAPVTSSAAYSDTPHSEPGTATIQTPQEASFDLSGGEKTTTTQGDQVNHLLNGDLSTSQPVRPSESADFKGTNSKRKLEGASTYEKSKAQHQTDRSEIPSSKDNNNEANEAIRSDLWPKENIESSGESEHQEQADQAVVQSPDGNMKQIEQTKTHDTETSELEERDLQENTNQINSKVSREEAFDSSGKQTSGVQLRSENIKDASNSADDAPDDIQTRSNSEENLTSYEESKVQQQSEGKTQGGETEAPLSDTVQQNERGLPENSYQKNSNQSQAEASDKSTEKFSRGIQNKNKSSSALDGPTDGTKSGDAEDKSG